MGIIRYTVYLTLFILLFSRLTIIKKELFEITKSRVILSVILCLYIYTYPLIMSIQPVDAMSITILST